MYIQRQSIFIDTLARNPYRIACGVFFSLLNFISGLTTNAFFYNESGSEFVRRCASAYPLTPRALLGAALWQTMLCCAAAYGRRGGARMTAAFAAISLESFVGGFSLSELLFHYGGKGSLPVLLLTAFCCVAGAALRIFIILPPLRIHDITRPHKKEALFTFPVIRALIVIILLQGIVIPALLCSN